MKWLLLVPILCILWPLLAHAQPARELAFPVVAADGIFDPSIADTPPGEQAWMSYSAVDLSPKWPEQNSRVTTRLAYSDDGGATWHDGGVRINGVSESLSGGKAISWNNEVSSLVYDPDAPSNAGWKLFWHHYAEIDGKRRFQHGWLAYKAAATPREFASVREIKLFGGAGYDHANDDAHGWTSPPLAGPPLLMLNALDPALGRCAAFTEPGAVWTKRALYLALACEEFHFIPPGVRPKIVLLSCTQPCRPSTPASWRYAGTPLTSDDANSFGFDGFTAADLYVDHDRAFLLVSPSSDHPVRGAYNGCIVFQLADIAAGSLARKDGRPILMERVSGTKGSFNGACTYQPTVSAAGVLYGEIDLSSRRPYFRIFSKNRLEITSH